MDQDGEALQTLGTFHCDVADRKIFVTTNLPMPPVLGSPVGDLEIDITPSVGLNLYRMTRDAASTRNEGSNQQTLGFGNVSNNGNEPTQTGIYLKKNAA